MLWKRVCFLPTVLFIDVGKCRRADLDTKLDLILANTWPFQVGDFPADRMEKPEPIMVRGSKQGMGPGTAAEGVARVIGSAKDPDKRRLDYFKKLMCQGEVSKAFRAITSDSKVLPQSPEGLEFLQSKLCHDPI